MLFFLILLFLALSAFFSGSEIAFVSANKLNVEIKRNKGSRRGNILGQLFDNPSEFLGAMLVGNNVALVVFTYLMTQLMEPFFLTIVQNEIVLLLINTLIITLIVLVFGEYLPKTLFRLYANEVLYNLSYLLKIFKVILKLPTWLTIKLTNLMLRWFVKSPAENISMALNRLDLQNYMEDTISSFNEEIDQEIFTNALNLNQLKVRDCMVPRMEIIEADKSNSVDDILKLFKETNVSRILVTNGDIDNVIGYIHHQKLLNNPKSVKPLIMDIMLVPDAMNAQDLMFKFIKENNNIACVVDEFGGTAGVITLEDVLEEIFGDIEDEYDIEDHIERQISETEFLFSGRLEIDDLNDKFDQLSFPEGEYQTLSGFLVMSTGNIPEKEGEVWEIDNYKFVIEKLSDTKIETVRVFINQKAKDIESTL
ncbi:MAG: hemolysin family protein [Saprospiraceae bacterium]|nr:hemolysin family protein [Saprospiraceae bacterium]